MPSTITAPTVRPGSLPGGRLSPFTSGPILHTYVPDEGFIGRFEVVFDSNQAGWLLSAGTRRHAIMIGWWW